MSIRILGLGNVLMGDDGFGPTVIHRLRSEWEFPAGVEVEDLGTPGLDLVPHLAGAELVILVDTIRSDGAAGERRRYDKGQILEHPPSARVGPHDPGLKECLLTLEFGNRAPGEVLLVGAIPQHVGTGITLSPALEDAVAVVATEVIDELTRRGILARRRPQPLPGTPWWWR